MVNIDVVGCGEVALQFHAPVLRHLRRRDILRVHGCYDRDAHRARRLCHLVGGVRWGTTPPPEAAHAVRAVLVATPPQFHVDAALPYVRASRHALIEKPFVGVPADAARLVDAARQAGCRVLVAHMRRFFPAVRTARDYLLAGGLGTVRGIMATEGGRWGSWAAASNYMVEDPYGGVLYDVGSHVLDTLLFILGADEDPDVRLEVTRVTRDRDREPSHDLRAEFNVVRNAYEPIPVRFAVSRTRALAAALRFEGDRGTLLVPGAFAASPSLIAGDRVFTLDRGVEGIQALDVLGALQQEHLALVDACERPEVTTVLDARRFLTLTRLLSSLADGDRRP